MFLSPWSHPIILLAVHYIYIRLWLIKLSNVSMWWLLWTSLTKRCRPNAVLLFLHRLQYRPSIKMTKEQPILLVWKRLSYLLHHTMRGWSTMMASSLCHVICGTQSHGLTLYCHLPWYKYLRTNHIGKQRKQIVWPQVWLSWKSVPRIVSGHRWHHSQALMNIHVKITPL